LIKQYYYLTKPGIIRGNLLATWAGFLLASKWEIDLGIFLAVTVGTALIIASGCVINNVIDRGIDKKMSRTNKRALVTGKISVAHALFFAGALGVAGFATILNWLNVRTAVLGFIGWAVYISAYAIAKRTSSLSTVIGSIAGAVPPAAGYVAVTNNYDMAALLLFLGLVFWQMPHFYALAMRRRDDYAAADLPVLPVKRSMRTTKYHIMAYIVAFYASVVGLFLAGYAGLLYLVAMSVCCIWWFWSGLKGFNTKNDAKWTGAMFGYSLIVLCAYCLFISVDPR
jgi:protoheme IX farnesyltransferase